MQNLTEGSIFKVLMKLSLPIMASAFLATAYSITDLAWIGIEIKGTNVIVKVVEADKKPDIINEEDFSTFIRSYACCWRECCRTKGFC